MNGMRLPRTKDDELWLRACAQVAIEEVEKPEDHPVWPRDIGLIEFSLIWMDE